MIHVISVILYLCIVNNTAYLSYVATPTALRCLINCCVIIVIIIKHVDATCAGIWIGLPACIEEFDELVKKFFEVSGDDRKQIVDEADKMKEAITDDTMKKERATVYVKAMQKVIENGDGYIDTEIARVEKLSEGKVSEKKKAQLKDRASILTSFQLRMSKKEEL